MPITANEGGTRYAHDNIMSNEGGTRYVIYQAWSFPELVDYYEAHPDVIYTNTSRSWSLDGDTYTGDVRGGTAANFTLTGTTKVTVTLKEYDYAYNVGTYVGYGVGIYDPQNSNEANPDTTNIAYIYGRPTGQSSYDTIQKLEGSVILPRGDYFIDVTAFDGTSSAMHAKFTVKFEKA